MSTTVFDHGEWTEEQYLADVVVIDAKDPDEMVAEASAVSLVCEITSPSNAGTDRILKMHYYAEAGIPWYLLIDPDPVTLSLYRLEGDRYVAHAQAGPGEVPSLTQPLLVQIDPQSLARRRRSE
jgi:Uma2 family endonuclease